MIDIVIPTYNQSDYTLNCFASINRARGDLRLIWVDNGSDTREFERVHAMLANGFAHEWKLIRLPENLGFVKATNEGLQHLRDGADVVLQNNDTIASASLYERLAEHARLCHGDVIGPQSTSGWQSVKRLAVKWPKHADLAKLDLDNVEKTASKLARRFGGMHVPVPKGGMVAFFCTFIRRKVIRRVGVLDEAFGVGLGDDDDYCARVQAAGFAVTLALDAYCWHAHRTTFKALYSPQEIATMQDRAARMLKARAL